MPSVYRQIPIFLLSTMVLLSSTLSLAWAFESFNPSRSFTATQTCTATRSIRSGGDPSPLVVDQVYTALGQNRPGAAGTHVQIDINGTRKWVELSCGQLGGASAAGPGPSPSPGPSAPAVVTELLPFFDQIDNPVELRVGGRVDVTPEPPTLSNFDQGINRICGAPGTHVDADAFKGLMREYPEVLDAIQAFTGGRIFRNRSSGFLEDLADLWFNNAGFEHVFCGEPNRGGIGGLHFWGRYFELQEKGLAGRLPNNTNNEEVTPGVIHTIGVVMKVGDRFVESRIKGYGLTLSAADILKVGTKAFVENRRACTLTVRDDGHTFGTVFVPRERGIRTFFPDATPNLGRNPRCSAPVELPTAQ